MTPDPAQVDRLLAETVWLRRLARSLVAGRDTADDVVQETLLRACQSPLHAVQNLRGWLGVVAASVARRFARTERRLGRRLQALPAPAPAPSAAEVVARTALQRDVMDAALRLREPYRSAVLLRFQGELGYAAIAARLDVPIETVRTRIKRALQMLREDLDARHGDTKAWALPMLGAGW
ncbi:MAG TPA: sigma-70 family RNA polymerase sigma factor, partial [Planctomycetota bacterium]|nr:sigma-70 family RNA polymerase sigma factor [Planctomycetota bacterium]